MNFRLALASLVLLLFFAVGCDDSPTDANTATNPSASLSFVVGDGGSLSKATSGHVTIVSAKLLLRTIQFHSVNDDDSSEFKTEAVIVDLDLTGGLNTIGVNDIAPGEYNKVSFRLHKPDDSENIDDTDFFGSDSAGGNERYSVVVTGLYDTTAFTYKSRSTANQRIVFDSALVITDTTNSVNVTLSVDVNSWFVSNQGNLDPTDAKDENAIDRAIRSSFRGFVDNGKKGGQN